jgi:hypothetical protein
MYPGQEYEDPRDVGVGHFNRDPWQEKSVNFTGSTRGGRSGHTGGSGWSGDKIRMRPSKYDGETPYEDYQVQFDMLSHLNNWDDTSKAMYLAGCLCGSARAVLADLPARERYSYTSLDRALRARFGTDDQSELFKAKLRSRTKQKGESLQELAHDVRRLVRLAHPSASSQTHEDLTKNQFIEALGDSEIRWNVFQSRPRTLMDPLKLALELDAFKESERSRLRKNIRGVGPEDDLVNAIANTDNKSDMSSVLQHMLAKIRQLGGVASSTVQAPDGMQIIGMGEGG